MLPGLRLRAGSCIQEIEDIRSCEREFHAKRYNSVCR
jgi:hypothetical protein